MENKGFQRNLETAIVFGTFNRKDFAELSLKSLLKALENTNTRVIVVDSSEEMNHIMSSLDIDYLWLPGDVSMAMARNIGYEYFKQKYISDWIMFVEDDIEYSDKWYNTLLNFAERTYGVQSPCGLFYGCFSASEGIKEDETVGFDEQNNCYYEFFGPRADQRLFKSFHYEAINHRWETDLLGISSFQTGTQIHRNTMRGFCSANISNLKLCKFLDGEESTWLGQRDIGPAAFDKRLEGYKSTIERANSLVQGKRISKTVAKISPKTDVNLTSVNFDEKIKTTPLRNFLKKIPFLKKIKNFFS